MPLGEGVDVVDHLSKWSMGHRSGTQSSVFHVLEPCCRMADQHLASTRHTFRYQLTHGQENKDCDVCKPLCLQSEEPETK